MRRFAEKKGEFDNKITLIFFVTARDNIHVAVHALGTYYVDQGRLPFARTKIRIRIFIAIYNSNK